MVVKEFNRAILKHFNASISLPVALFSGADDKEWVELRILGPREERRHPENIKYLLDIDCLVQVDTTKNIYALHDAVDEVRSAFSCIDTSYGHLVPGDVRVIPFGKYTNMRHERAAVIGEYSIYVEGIHNALD